MGLFSSKDKPGAAQRAYEKHFEKNEHRLIGCATDKKVWRESQKLMAKAAAEKKRSR